MPGKRVRPVYERLESADRLLVNEAKGGHRFYPDIAWPALAGRWNLLATMCQNRYPDVSLTSFH